MFKVKMIILIGLEPFLGPLGPSWGDFVRSWGGLGAVLWRSWGDLGVILGRLGAVLGVVLGRLGASWGGLGATWGGFGASWGGLAVICGCLGVVLGSNRGSKGTQKVQKGHQEHPPVRVRSQNVARFPFLLGKVFLKAPGGRFPSQK